MSLVAKTLGVVNAVDPIPTSTVRSRTRTCALNSNEKFEGRGDPGNNRKKVDTRIGVMIIDDEDAHKRNNETGFVLRYSWLSSSGLRWSSLWCLIHRFLK